jgi:hypothetical protein
MATRHAAAADGAAPRPHCGGRRAQAVTQLTAEPDDHCTFTADGRQDEPGEAGRARTYRAELACPAVAVLQPGPVSVAVAHAHADPHPEIAIGHEQTAVSAAGSCPAAG